MVDAKFLNCHFCIGAGMLLCFLVLLALPLLALCFTNIELKKIPYTKLTHNWFRTYLNLWSSKLIEILKSEIRTKQGVEL